MNKDTKPKHHLICMNCRVQSTGNSVKECEKKFGNCGTTGGVPDDACKTTIYQDGVKVFTLVKTSILVEQVTKQAVLEDKLKAVQTELKLEKSKLKAKTVKPAPVKPSTTITPDVQSPIDGNQNS